MKKIKLFPITIGASAVYLILFCFGCRKHSVVPVNNILTSNPVLIYSLDDTLGNTSTQLWAVTADGTKNKQIPVSIPANLHFEFESNIAAEVSTDNKTMALSLENSDGSITYFYKSNIDGSNVQQIPNASGFIYLQAYINTTSILYWKNAINGHNGELWTINTDGSNNQKINITLPDNIYFGDGKFAKVTPDGKTIIFATFSNTTTSPIYKCNIDGTGLILVTSGTTPNVQALTDNTILYNFYVNNTPQLWMVNTDGTNKHQVTPALTNGLSVTSDSNAEASSNALFFVGTNNQNGIGTEAIYSSNLDGTNVKLVANVPKGYAVKLQGVIQ